MSRMYSSPKQATEANKQDLLPQVPTTGLWTIAYGLDHTDVRYFIDFEPLDNEAKRQCTPSWTGEVDEEGQPTGDCVPQSEWEYNPISLDCLFTSRQDGRIFNAGDWMNILHSFGIEG